MTRSVLALGLLLALCTSACAATAQRFKRTERHVHPSQRVADPKQFAVPGWSDEATKRWLDNASSAHI